MISKLVRLAVLILSGVVVLGASLWAQPVHPAACSDASVHGKYGFTINGTVNGKPITAVGQIATNGSGGLAGNETISDNGSVRNLLEVLGKYAIKSDCTGTMTIQAQGRSKQNFNVTVISGGKQIDMVQTDSGTTNLGTAQAQASNSCSVAGVKGVYGLQGGGTEIGVGPFGPGWADYVARRRNPERICDGERQWLDRVEATNFRRLQDPPYMPRRRGNSGR